MSAAAIIIAVVIMLGGTDLYLARRIHQGLKHIAPNIGFGWVIGIVAVLTLLLVLGFARSLLPLSAVVRSVLGIASSYMMGIFAYLLMFIILADIVIAAISVFGAISRPVSGGIRFAALTAAVVLTVGTVCCGIYHAGNIQHVSYDIQIKDKDCAETKIVMISDLHLGAVGSEKRLESIVSEINALFPDIVCIAGDFFDNDYNAIRDPDAAAETLRKLNAVHGVYACLGNHDSGETFEQMMDFLDECGIIALRDEYTVIDGRIVLVGRLDASPIGGYGDIKRGDLAQIMDNADTSMPVIVMDHNPANADSYKDEVDLILAGHTHKGQIFPANLITKFMYTVDYGYYQRDADSPHVVVSSGVGTWGMPMRVGTDCEIVTITFS